MSAHSFDDMLKVHPFPWSVVEEGDRSMDNIGGIKDANGDWVVWLGDRGQYYPTPGYAVAYVLDFLTLLANAKGGSLERR